MIKDLISYTLFVLFAAVFFIVIFGWFYLATSAKQAALQKFTTQEVTFWDAFWLGSNRR